VFSGWCKDIRQVRWDNQLSFDISLSEQYFRQKIFIKNRMTYVEVIA